MPLLPSIRREKARRHLADFVRQAWPVVEPEEKLVDNWHIDLVCEHLEAVARGEIRKLVIAIPPGHMKSTIVSVMFPAWVWANGNPGWRGIFASYDKTLAIRDSLKSRAVVESEWYRANFSGPAGWGLKLDANLKTKFDTTREGFRQSAVAAVGGTGHRANCIVVDDALDVKKAMQRSAREAVERWFFKAMSNRLTDMQTGSFVVMGQRLHRQDLSGLCLAKGYELLSLPSRYDPKRSRVVVGADIRKTEGELLFPARFPESVLAEQETDLGSSGFSAQHQQDPVAEGGAMFKREWWRFYRADGAAPKTRPEGCNVEPAILLPDALDMQSISVDCTFKDTDDGSNVALQVWGASGARRFLLDRVLIKANFNATLAELRALVERWPRALWKWVEDKANGPAVISTLEAEISGLIAVSPEGGKEARAHACTAEVQAGNVYLPEGAPWLEEYLDALSDFPFGEQDDDVDATTQALTQFREDGYMLALRKAVGG